MSSNQLYSVIIPTCGRVPLLLETLASLTNQTIGNFEVVITDDSPREDDQQAIRRAAEEFQSRTGKRAKYVYSRPRLYQAANTNQGLTAAQGDLLRILHSDDLLRSDALEYEAHFFAQNPNVEVMFQDCIPFTHEIAWEQEPREVLVHPAYHLRTELSHSTALPSGLVFRRPTIDRAGLMDERLRFLCDWDFFCRLLLDQARQHNLVCRLSPGLFGWRTHADSVTGTLWKTHFEEHELYIREFLARPELDELRIFSGGEQEQFVARALQYRYDRVWSDFERLSLRERSASLPWMVQRLGGSYAIHMRKRLLKSLERQLKRLVKKPKGPRPAPQDSPAVAEAKRRTFRSVAENLGAVAIMPFYDGQITATHQTALLLDFDNAMHLWPYREQLAKASPLQLFYVNYNRMYERTLHEVLKYVAVSQEVEILLGGNHHLQWFGLKAVVDRLFPGQFVLAGQANIAGDFYSIKFRRQESPPEYLQGHHTGWSFGLLTLGTNRERVLEYVSSIELAAPADYEILVVTPRKLTYLDRVPNIRQILFSELDDVGWITRKKNLICQNAKYSDILICHDRYALTPTFCTDWNTWGYSYGIAAPRVQLKDGRRGLDWAVASSQNHAWSHGGLLDYRSYSPYAYVPGGTTAVRKSFWEKFPWNENLYWNEHEDVELCRRAQRSGELISLSSATLIASADRWIDQNPILPFNPDRDVLFGAPVGEQQIDFLPMPKTKAA